MAMESDFDVLAMLSGMGEETVHNLIPAPAAGIGVNDDGLQVLVGTGDAKPRNLTEVPDVLDGSGSTGDRSSKGWGYTTEDREASAEQSAASTSSYFWERVVSDADTGVLSQSLMGSLADLVKRLRVHGFRLPWTCAVCSAENQTAFGACGVCKTQNQNFSAALAMDARSTDEKPAAHPLLALASVIDGKALEACLLFAEALVREGPEPNVAVHLYQRAFKLWPELDSDLCPDGVPMSLRRAADDAAVDSVGHAGIVAAWVALPANWAPPVAPPAPLPQQELREPVLMSFDLAGVARYIMEHKARRIVVLCGAGISTSAGIPDFRSPGSGLYSRLQKYNLPKPEAMFSLNYFRANPAPFYELAQELWPGNFKPTLCHHFIRLLHEKGLLQRCYTQNIDSLELLAGLPPELLVQAHGSFEAAHMIDTEPEVLVDVETLREALQAGESGWRDLCDRSGGLVKPKIVFFGEALPQRFADLQADDVAACDLLLVLGTSLAVGPVNSLVAKVGIDVPRVLLNRDEAGRCDSLLGGLRYHLEDGTNHRDVFLPGEVDGGARALAEQLGWASELKALTAGDGHSVARPPWALAPQPLRQVKLLGLCGASGSGKSWLAAKLAEEFKSPVQAIQGDKWMKHRDLPCCSCQEACFEQPESVDLPELARRLRHLVQDLACCDLEPGIGPPFQPSGVALCSKAIVVVVESYVLFAEPQILSLCDHLMWLELDSDTACMRRFERDSPDYCSEGLGGERSDDGPLFQSFRRDLGDHVYRHHAENSVVMRRNVGSRHCIDIDAAQPQESVAAAAVAALRPLLQGGSVN